MTDTQIVESTQNLLRELALKNGAGVEFKMIELALTGVMSIEQQGKFLELIKKRGLNH